MPLPAGASRTVSMITNAQSGTRIDEIAAGLYRISTPVSVVPGGFSFNQYLVLDEQPLLFHTGPRRMFPLVKEAIAAVMPVQRLRYISFSHYEADECGGLNEFLSVAPAASPLCGQIAAMVSIGDVADRAPVVLGDGATRRTCLMHGNADSSWKRARRRSSAAISLRKAARTILP